MKWVCVPRQLLGQAFQGLQTAWPCALPLGWSCSRGTFREKRACPGCRGLGFALSHSVIPAGGQAPSPAPPEPSLDPRLTPKGLRLSPPALCSVLSRTVWSLIIFEQRPSKLLWPTLCRCQVQAGSQRRMSSRQHGFWLGLVKAGNVFMVPPGCLWLDTVESRGSINKVPL